jgi:hypothetical protein
MHPSFLKGSALLTLALLPAFAFAQLRLDTSTDGIAEGMLYFIYFLNFYLIPFLFAVALVAFLFNVFRYAIVSGDKDSIDKAKKQMVYGVLALVFIVSFWGIVNLVVRGFLETVSMTRHLITTFLATTR